MTLEEKIAAVDRYFDSVSSDDFNRLLEEKYGIPMVTEPSCSFQEGVSTILDGGSDSSCEYEESVADESYCEAA